MNDNKSREMSNILGERTYPKFWIKKKKLVHQQVCLSLLAFLWGGGRAILVKERI